MESESAKFKRLFNSIGKVGLNALFPNDFELYMFSLELVNSDGDTEEFLTFPVMPSSLKYSKNFVNNNIITAGGVVSLTSSIFIPTLTTLSGNFGRKLALSFGTTRISSVAFHLSLRAGNLVHYGEKVKLRTSTFSPIVKTGFGAVKILEGICDKSDTLDSKGKPYTLYAYNPASGHNYICKVKSFSMRQGEETNMIWDYDLTLENIGRIDSIKAAKNILRAASMSIISNEVNALAGDVRELLTS